MQLKPAVLGVVSPWSPGHSKSKALAQEEQPPTGILIAAAAIAGFQGAALFGAFGDTTRTVVIYVTGGAAILSSLLYIGDLVLD